MKTGRHSLLLLEIVLDLFIFAICAVVCTGLLVRARQMGNDSQTLTDAVFAAQSAAETWRAGGQPANQDGAFSIEIEPMQDNQVKEAVTISVLLDGKEIYTIEEVARP